MADEQYLTPAQVADELHGRRWEQLAMLRGVEFIEFDFDHPHAGKASFAAELRRLAEQQRKQGDVEALIAVAVCVAVIVLLLSDGAAEAALG